MSFFRVQRCRWSRLRSFAKDPPRTGGFIDFLKKTGCFSESPPSQALIEKQHIKIFTLLKKCKQTSIKSSTQRFLPLWAGKKNKNHLPVTKSGTFWSNLGKARFQNQFPKMMCYNVPPTPTNQPFMANVPRRASTSSVSGECMCLLPGNLSRSKLHLTLVGDMLLYGSGRGQAEGSIFLRGAELCKDVKVLHVIKDAGLGKFGRGCVCTGFSSPGSTGPLIWIPKNTIWQGLLYVAFWGVWNLNIIFRGFKWCHSYRGAAWYCWWKKSCIS